MNLDPQSEPLVEADDADLGASDPVPWWRRYRSPLVAAAVTFAVIAALVGGYAAGRSSSSPTPAADGGSSEGQAGAADQPSLAAAKQTCAPHDPTVSVGDHGASLVLSRVAAEERPGASLEDLVCILLFIEMPDAVVSQMESTRALDGRQEAAWGDFSASWTYHPKSGLNVILQESR